jgi:hypothetical protein
MMALPAAELVSVECWMTEELKTVCEEAGICLEGLRKTR